MTPLSGRVRPGLLSLLLARANIPVPAESLLDALWGEHRDPAAVQRLQTNVHKLRKALDDPGRLRFDSGGYLLRVGPGELDADRFDELVARAADTDDARHRAELLRAALGLWRGRPFQGLDLGELAAHAQRLTERRRAAAEELYAAELDCGRHRAVVAELDELARRHPLRERLQVLLMVALSHSGRQADALAAYRRARRALVDELGLEPGPELREAERRILAGENPTTGSSAGAGATAPAPRPAQLPQSPLGFVGRQAELATLDRLSEVAGAATGVVAVTGTAGVGKTALVTRWAQRHRERFPDGQLYVDLQGFSPRDPLPPAAALGGFLRALGEDPAAIPQDATERAARFRTLTDGRRVLVVLDNAATAEQVRPLLPGAPSCFAVVTSRDALRGLTAGDGAHRLDVDLMPSEDARALLHARVPGLGREPAARLIEHCARLPLALRVAAERLGHSGADDVTALVGELDDEQDRLDLLDTGDEHTSIRSVLSWSYRRLAPESARLFRLCGFRCSHPRHYLDAHGACALLGTADVRTARRLLGELVRCGLLEEAAPGRYHMHALLQAYATELAGRSEPHTGAQLRLIGHYLDAAVRAAGMVHRPETALLSGGGSVASTVELAGCAPALRWLDAQRPNLICAAEWAAENGHPAHTVDLATTLWPYLDLGGHHDEARRLHTLARAAARGLGASTAEGLAVRALGVLALRLRQPDEAAELLREALDLHGGGDLGLCTTTATYLAAACAASGRVDEAIRLGRRAIDPGPDAAGPPALAMALTALGGAHRQCGRHDEALRCLRRACDIAAEHDHRAVHAQALLSLAELHRDLGRHADAVECADRAREVLPEPQRDLVRSCPRPV